MRTAADQKNPHVELSNQVLSIIDLIQ